MKRHMFGRCAVVLSMAIAGVALAETMDNPQANMVVLKDQVASPGTVRASKLIDTDVYDPAGKDVGKIRDIVFDRTYDKVAYTVVGHGGTAGIGETLVAMPYKILTFGGPNDERMYVKLPEDVIDKAPGFDDSKWPTEANADYYRSLDAYYDTRIGETLGEAKTAGPDAEAQKASATLSEPADLPWTRRATKLLDRDVLSPSSEKLGNIEDLVLDTQTGNVRYAVLASGGDALGTGQKYYAVPLNQFRTQAADKKLVLDTTRADLKNSPSFDKEHWPSQADPRWQTPASKGEIMR